MKEDIRKYLLSQVSIVLSECQKLVCQLSVIPNNEDDDQDCLSVSSSSSVMSAASSDVSYVTPPEPDHYDQFWWDSYVSQLSQFSAEFYSLTSPVYGYADPLPTQSSESTNIIKHKSESIKSSLSRRESTSLPNPDKNDKLISKLLSVISLSSSSNVYNRKWKEEKMNNFIYPEFRDIWINSLVMFCDQEEIVPVSISPSPPVIRYPTIDISKCNVRSIANVPKPQKYPVLGCSDDPDFYFLSNTYTGKPTGGFYKCSPHGQKYGYRTNLGIVPVPDEPVHGYVWDGTDDSSDWVLHAVKPSNRCDVAKRNHGHSFKFKGFREKRQRYTISNLA